ncbi:MAG TPA: DUF2264 domain-containing protein [Candidatus Saccharimonadales bacterium]|nr:DUF2264 domain-containing protein [Candidatus Saccharimonadales bacterium]
MRNRRSFLKTLAAASALGATSLNAAQNQEVSSPGPQPKISSGSDDRAYWIGVVERVATPVLSSLAKRQLRNRMPVDTNGDVAGRRLCTHLEAFARTLAGVAPWLEAPNLTGDEATLRQRFVELARTCMDVATDPASPDFLNFNQGSQPLVDSGFLAQAILRSPGVLWSSLDQRVRRQVLEALKSSRVIKPANNNWTLFAALVEAVLCECGEPTIEERLEDSLRRMLKWYLGDGVYGDGPQFHFDHYNSFVIHPALVDILEVLKRRDDRFAPAYDMVLERARRYAQIQERLIAPDGTFPAVGRSLAYRFGAFHGLAQMALKRQLPDSVKPAQGRCALTAVIRRMIEAPGTFDPQGWLRVGFCGQQLLIGESYISTGSLYLCTVGLLPLGLSPHDSLWTAPAARWTSQRLWSGESLPSDHALHEKEMPPLPILRR